jgi:hypothetical protein
VNVFLGPATIGLLPVLITLSELETMARKIGEQTGTYNGLKRLLPFQYVSRKAMKAKNMAKMGKWRRLWV